MKPLLISLLILMITPAWSAGPVWRVETEGKALYLVGTVHVLRATDYPLPQALDQAYAQSAKLVFETDIEISQNPEFTRKMLSAVTLPAGQQLSQLLTKDTLSELDTHLISRGLTLAQFESFKPAMTAITLTLQELHRLGVGDRGVDQYYYELAKQEGKPTLALETPQQQIDFIANMGEGLEDLMIRQTLEDIKTLDTQFEDMIINWREGNTMELEELFVTPMRDEFDPIYQQLLIERNRNWMPKLVEFLENPQTEMVLVGSAHLLGEEGLLQLLLHRGYKITQLD